MPGEVKCAGRSEVYVGEVRCAGRSEVYAGGCVSIPLSCVVQVTRAG